MGDTKSSPKKGTDRSDSTETEIHPRSDPRSAEKRLEEAIDQTALAIGQLKERGDVLAESRARSSYTALKESLELAENADRERDE